MAPVRTEDTPPHELLFYLTAYRVVICSRCRYAIPPSAIGRHLKDIHRLRKQRRSRYLQYVAGLPLAEPDQVKENPVKSFPISLLPVEDGFACSRGTCGYLCASSKRMKGHWTKVHGRSGTQGCDWQEVPLQTFFRGIHLRYFTDPRLLLLPQKTQNTQVVTYGQRPCPSVSPIISDSQDAFLLHHYVTITSLTLDRDPETTAIWHNLVPQLAPTYPFLQHGILCCAALHLAHLRQDSQPDFKIRALYHYDEAMPAFRTAIKSPDKTNSNAVLIFAHLLVICSFAFEFEDERFLLGKENSRDVVPMWLYLVRNGCSMLCDVWTQIAEGPVKALVDAWQVPLTEVSEVTRESHVEYLLSLRPSTGSDCAWSSELDILYHDAATKLASAFAFAEALGERCTTWDLLRIWPLHISGEFLELLSARHPAALILLAHYAVLLKKVEGLWYLEGRATALLTNVFESLEERWHGALAIPLSEIPLVSRLE